MRRQYNTHESCRPCQWSRKRSRIGRFRSGHGCDKCLDSYTDDFDRNPGLATSRYTH